MFKQAANQQLLQNVSACCMYIENDDCWTSAVVLTKEYAVTALHCIPDSFRKIGSLVILHDAHGQQHNGQIHGMNEISDYAVIKKTDGVFGSVPELASPMLLDKYIVLGFTFGERKPSVRLGHISSLSTGTKGFFYGDSGSLPGFSGGGVFYERSGALMGIARGCDWDGKVTKQYSDVLEMISAQVILGHVELFRHQPFSV
ncbi:unnamed protein product [Caenorhabditis sp. 36 PRJEB53466]|nr:unnamed protein product [Caenorhabditis sp. 36 PRJEB53466]